MYRRVKNNKDYFLHLMAHPDSSIIIETESPDTTALKDRLLKWCDLASRNSTMKYDLSMDALKTMFFKDVK